MRLGCEPARRGIRETTDAEITSGRHPVIVLSDGSIIDEVAWTVREYRVEKATATGRKPAGTQAGKPAE